MKKPAEKPELPQLLTTRDAAKMLAISTTTLLRMGADGTIPPPVRMSPTLLRWRVTDLQGVIDGGGRR